MYWNNSIITAKLTDNIDPVVDSMHQGQHCLFYNPAVPIHRMVKLISLQDTCDLANQWLQNTNSIDSYGELDKVANAVRINQYVHSLRQYGNFKPMLLNFAGTWPLGASTGGSRVMAAERCPNIKTFSAFVATHSRFQQQFSHWQPVTTFEQFAALCGASKHTEFYFRLTDATAAWGLDWYEAALEHTSVPGNEQCLRWLRLYANSQPCDFKFTPQWFDSEIDWPLLDVINNSG